jgi:hypothetical protein
VYLDFVGEMPATAVASIHNDPEQGTPSWVRGLMLDSFDQEAGQAIFDLVKPGSDSPFLAVEVRQIGGATARDAADGTSVGGRESRYTLSTIAGNPATFDELAPARAAELTAAVADKVSATTNVNWSVGLVEKAAFEKTWPPAVFNRLAAARTEWDPRQVFAFGPQ